MPKSCPQHHKFCMFFNAECFFVFPSWIYRKLLLQRFDELNLTHCGTLQMVNLMTDVVQCIL